MSPYRDNPAGRLQRLFEKAKNVPQGERAVTQWAHIFDLDPNDYRLILERFGEMVTLATDTREQVAGLADEDPELLLQYFPEVESTLERCLQVAGQTMEWHLSGLSAAGLQSLALCSSVLHRRAPEATVSVGELALLLDKVQSLIRDVTEADDLDVETKRFILDKLMEVQRSILDFSVRGAGPIRRAADSMLGSLVTQPGRWRRVSTSTIVNSLFMFIALLDSTLHVAAEVRELGSPSEPRPEIVRIWIDSTGHQTPKQLSQRSSDQDGPNDVIDAEIVEDGEGQTP